VRERGVGGGGWRGEVEEIEETYHTCMTALGQSTVCGVRCMVHSA
jgi:hypothetical protein